MTKRELVNELAKYGIKATTRARKDTLVELLELVKEDAKKDSQQDAFWIVYLIGAVWLMFIAGVYYNAV